MKKQEIIKYIKEQHERDLDSLIDFLERNIPDNIEENTAKCYCGNPVDTSNPDCVQFNLCEDHQMDA